MDCPHAPLWIVIRQNHGGQTFSSDKVPILKFSHIFCHVISRSLHSWVVFSHLFFLPFFLAKANWHIRAWFHSSYLALSAQFLLWSMYHQVQASSLCSLECWCHHSQQSHKLNLLPWVGSERWDGTEWENDTKKRRVSVLLLGTRLCLGKTVQTPWRMG